MPLEEVEAAINEIDPNKTNQITHEQVQAWFLDHRFPADDVVKD